jgi:hypothetical protein
MVPKALQAPLLAIKSKDHVSKREKKKMEKMSHDFGRAQECVGLWTKAFFKCIWIKHLS